MITENRLTTYINSLAQGDGSLIETIAENAEEQGSDHPQGDSIALKDDGDAGGSEQDP